VKPNLRLHTTSTSLPTDVVEDLGESLRQAANYLATQATAVGAAWPSVRVLVADDFPAAVARILEALHGPKSGSFKTMRIGGTVAAKTMPDPLSEGGFAIVVDSSLATLDDPEIVGVPVVSRTFLLAHELAHVLIESTRRDSGVLDSLPDPSSGSDYFARGITRIAADEYRADMVAADAIASLCYVVTEKGERVAAPVTATAAINFMAAVVEDLAAMHPRLPDTVDRYRHRLLGLEEMWAEVQGATEQSLNLIAHAQAVLDATIPGRHNVLTAPNLASRASELYFADLWAVIYDRLSSLPPLPSASDHRRTEPGLVEAGARAIGTFWRRLGINPIPQSDGSEYLKVDAPVR
jgi:hypothetical protein